MTDKASMWQRSTTRRFLKWLFSWRTARRLLIGAACLVTLWALFCTEENIRGKRTWEKYRRELEGRGEQLDFKSFIPPPVPDGQNFAATPVVQSWFSRQDNPRWNDNYSRAEAKVKVGWDHRSLMDLVAWARAFAETNSNKRVKSGPLDLPSRAKVAAAILETLKEDEAVFAELRAASRRPYSRYPVGYDVEDPFMILLPHLSSVRAVCRRLRLKACAELVAGRSTEALEDVKLMLYLADSLKDEPFLIVLLVRIACLQQAIQPIWEGLADHAWSSAQLEELQTRLQQRDYNFVADLKRCFEAERAAGVQVVETIRTRGIGYLVDLFRTDSSSPSYAAVGNAIGLFIPSGWLSLEESNLCRAYQTLSEGTIDSSQPRVFPDRSEANVREFERDFEHGGFRVVFVEHRWLAAMLLPALNRCILKAAMAQTIADQTVLACVLERYRLANGQFPGKLEALVPQFIAHPPNDVITGEPYKYGRTDDDRFVLYSVGWDETDDGGMPGKTDFDEKHGDWVWQYPPAR